MTADQKRLFDEMVTDLKALGSTPEWQAHIEMLNTSPALQALFVPRGLKVISTIVPPDMGRVFYEYAIRLESL